MSIGGGAMIGPQGAFLAELFSTRVRFTAFAVGSGLGSAIGGEASWVIATALFAGTGGGRWLVGALVIGASAITALAIVLAPETKSVDIATHPGRRATAG